MNYVRCFNDVAVPIIKDATKNFAPEWVINNENLDIFKDYCAAIDEIAAEFDGESYEVEVDEDTKDIIVALECREITIKSRKHILYQLAERAIQYSFSVSEDGYLLVKFVFPSLWYKN